MQEKDKLQLLSCLCGLLGADNPTTIKESNHESPFSIGESLFIRTVTYHLTGKVVGIKVIAGTAFLVLEQAAWIADSGRFTQAINNGTLSEVAYV